MRIARLTLVFALISAAAAPAAAQASRDSLRQGFEALDSGDADKAATIFGQALAIAPSDPVALYGAGVAAHLQGNAREARRFLTKAVQAEPRLVAAAALLGEIAHQEGDLRLAIETYERVLKYTPADSTLRDRLADWRREADVQNPMVAFKDDRFAILFDGPANENLAARAGSVLGKGFFQIGRALGAYPSASMNVILYTDKQFRDITRAPEWSAGGYDGQIRIPVRGAAQDVRQFDRVLVHELTHAMLASLAPRNLPVWLNEGLAMYFDGTAAGAERQLARIKVFVPLAALDDSFTELTAAQATLAYEMSGFAATALITRVGAANVGLLLQDLAAGQTMEQAVQRFGFTLDQFQADLRRRVGAR